MVLLQCATVWMLEWVTRGRNMLIIVKNEYLLNIVLSIFCINLYITGRILKSYRLPWITKENVQNVPVGRNY